MTAMSLKIVRGRLLDTIQATAKYSALISMAGVPKGSGVCRLSLSDNDKNVRDWFVKEVKSLGCEVKIDKVGNIFATYPGKKDGLPTAIGSHLDTQPTGGRYDGIYGVLTGLEVLRTLKENKYVPNYPISLVNWTNEEGARFPMSVMASALWAGRVAEDEVFNLKSVIDTEAVTVDQELNRIGYKGPYKASYKSIPLKAHFELHIEQGPILEKEDKRVGIVTGAQAYCWNKVIIKGSSSHTGTTPLDVRSDALLAASKMIVKCNELAHEYKGLVSVGVCEVKPRVVNVIPNEVTFTYDARHPHDEPLEALNEELYSSFKNIAIETLGPNCKAPIEVSVENLMRSKAVHFDPHCISCVREASIELLGEENVMDIVSGAGHDSCATNNVCPTTMIFIPSKEGISHHPDEYSTPQQIEDGFDVLLKSVLKYDSKRVD
ncbi:uncharacterized protein PRCAT00000109001 [Priceomyces carsonii]|uniref:uncharacterized protein n=1 Tax=Priceomyces carsonii TaxID=28549 RepID=UPI002EDB2942|nr:unnamed protein product [Priceomyces carsonii]